MTEKRKFKKSNRPKTVKAEPSGGKDMGTGYYQGSIDRAVREELEKSMNTWRDGRWQDSFDHWVRAQFLKCFGKKLAE